MMLISGRAARLPSLCAYTYVRSRRRRSSDPAAPSRKSMTAIIAFGRELSYSIRHGSYRCSGLTSLSNSARLIMDQPRGTAARSRSRPGTGAGAKATSPQARAVRAAAPAGGESLRRCSRDTSCAAETWTAALRLARQSRLRSLCRLRSPGLGRAGEVCRRIREFDAHTPLILYSAQLERSRTPRSGCAPGEPGIRRALRRRAQPRRDGGTAHHAGGAAQHGGAAARSATRCRRTSRAGWQPHRGAGGSAPRRARVARLKIEACRIFAVGGRKPR